MDEGGEHGGETTVTKRSFVSGGWEVLGGRGAKSIFVNLIKFGGKMSKIPFSVVRCDGEDADYPCSELNIHR